MRRLPLLLLVVGGVVITIAVLAFRSAAAPDPDPSLGPVVHVTSHSTGGQTPHRSRTPTARGDHNGTGASPVVPRTPEGAGDDGDGLDDDSDDDEDHEDHDDADYED